MCAGTGAVLHLAGPLGFNFDEKHVRRAGLDYHDLATVVHHETIDAALGALTRSPRWSHVGAAVAQDAGDPAQIPGVGAGAAVAQGVGADGAASAQSSEVNPTPRRVFAFTTAATSWHTDVTYRPGDVLLFGPEPTGLAPDVLADPRVTQHLRIPMLPGRRSMNLSNAAAVACYEAWRQLDFPGAV